MNRPYGTVPPSDSNDNDSHGSSRPSVVEACHYAVLNLPSDATLAHIQRNFKQLSRVYHPDKVVSVTNDGTATSVSSVETDIERQRRFALAQQTFVRIKTAADILSDPVYRLAYTYGGSIAVMLVKRSQATRQAHTADTETSFQEDDDSVDLYTLLERHVNEPHSQAAASIIAQFVQEYHAHQEQLQSPASPLEFSFTLPHVLVESDSHSFGDVSFVQRESAKMRVSSKHTVNHSLATTWSASSDLSRTAQIKFNGAVGLDYQPVAGTRVKTEVAVPLAPHERSQRQPTLSLQTTRQTAAGTVLVAMVGGPATRRGLSSWNATFMSSKLLQWDSLWGTSNTPNASSDDDTKVMATWRLSLNPRGQLGYFMAGVKSMDFPSWACRVCLGAYPFKVSWRSAETEAFYVTCALGMMTSRVKLVRIASLDHVLGSAWPHSSWTLAYGLKYDGQAGLSGQSPWSLLCHLQSDSLSVRIPIVLETVTPIAWLISVVCALFVDHHFESLGTNWLSVRSQHDEQDPHNRQQSRVVSIIQERPWADVMRTVAAKKREIESSRPDGLVIHQAQWSGALGKDADVKDALQYWIVDGKLGPMSLKDSRVQWHSNPPLTTETKASLIDDSWLSWWNRWWRNQNDGLEDAPSTTESVVSLTIRYQYRDTMYEIYLVQSDVIELPHPNAIELGPANRIR